MPNCIKCGADCCSCKGCVLNEGKWCNTCYTQIVEERLKETKEKEDNATT